MRLYFVAVLFLFGAFATPSLAAQSKRAAVCVKPISPAPPRWLSPGENYNPDTLSIKFDQRETVPWSKNDWTKFDDFDPAVRHLVVLASDGKRIQSFWFRFTDYRTDSLCLSFDGYQGVQLQKSMPRCKCN